MKHLNLVLMALKTTDNPDIKLFTKSMVSLHIMKLKSTINQQVCSCTFGIIFSLFQLVEMNSSIILKHATFQYAQYNQAGLRFPMYNRGMCALFSLYLTQIMLMKLVV